ncbi:hypothetical protein GR160_07060 [Flavobacterium sp. Sd200]|uniref:hypothetical protein n=1 Tax=Flavobacterium sp. Sd200 TaxID=2692211 RepID=UPI00136ADE6C|nr:hypothetical protein [Flavobacterium sp. Sd200]MXN90984.1 hypothetical protein [Flavobacterium sp. Sd200]
MKKKVLVYDNQLGYYEMLVRTIKKGYEFFLYKNKSDADEEYDAIAFFLHDEIEHLDMVRVYRPELPFVFAIGNKQDASLKTPDNVFIIDLDRTKGAIVKKFKDVFRQISLLVKKEEAL